MYRGLCLITLLIYIFPGIPAVAQRTRAVPFPHPFTTRNIDNTNGLNCNMVLDITEDKTGYIWIGTEKGLLRYDGLRFMSCFDPQTKPQQLYVANLYPDDAKGRLLFSERDGKMMQWNYLLHSTSAVTASGPRARAWDCQDQRRERWQFRESWADTGKAGIRGIVQFSMPESFKGLTGYFARANGSDEIVLFVPGHRLELLDQSTNTIRPLPFPLDPGTIQGMSYDRQGYLWLYSWNNLFYRYDGRNKKLYRYSLKDILKQEGNESTLPVWISSILQDDHGVLWLGTGQAGLLRYDYDRDRFEYILREPGNSLGLQYTDQINGLFQDKEENIWIGTDQGISIINPYREYFTALSNRDSAKPANVVSDIIPVSLINNELWMGSWGGGIKVYDSAWHLKRNYFFPGRYDSNMIWSFLPLEDGTVWVGCQTGLVLIIDTRTNKVRSIRPTEADGRTIKCLARDNSGNILLALHSGKIIVYDTAQRRFLPYLGDDWPKRTSIENLYVDKQGICWVSTTRGLAAYDPKTRRYTGFYQPEPGVDVRCWGVCSYQDSLLIVGTENDGLYFFDRRRHSFQRVPVNEEQSHWSAYAVAVDSTGKIWFSTDYTICNYDAMTGKCLVNQPEKGIINSSFQGRDFLRTSGGRWITWTATEVVGFYPEMLRAVDQRRSKVTITGFRVFSTPVYIDSLLGRREPVSLGYKQNFISIDFSSLRFSGIGRSKYYYRLEGVDPDWVYGGSRGVASYTNLQPGDYTFRVRTENSGSDAEITAFTLRIAAPFWAKWWFRCMVAGLILFGIFVLLRWRDRRVRREAGMKQQIVRTEMMALRAQMNPHFIFNCINGIDALIQSNDKYQATIYLNKFARLIRNILDSSKHETVTLARDLETLQLYIDLERFRSEDRFVAEINVDKDLLEEDCRVPPLIVQPYVENAILHGLRLRPGKTGKLTIGVSREAEYLVYRIEDNGVGRAAASTSPGHRSYGMEMSSDRVNLFNREDHIPVVITDLEEDGRPTGTRVQVSLKLN